MRPREGQARLHAAACLHLCILVLACPRLSWAPQPCEDRSPQTCEIAEQGGSSSSPLANGCPLKTPHFQHPDESPTPQETAERGRDSSHSELQSVGPGSARPDHDPASQPSEPFRPPQALLTAEAAGTEEPQCAGADDSCSTASPLAKTADVHVQGSGATVAAGSAPEPALRAAVEAELVAASAVLPVQMLEPGSTLLEELEKQEGHNLALAKDGAKIIAANKEARKAGAALDGDGDTFLKNECRAEKWFILELSQVARVHTLAIGQYELYSSRVREFEVRVRLSHPRAEGPDYARNLSTAGWRLLGRFAAANAKGLQARSASTLAFRVPGEAPWAKFLQFHFQSHHGGEAVCALNELRVFGKTASEDLEDRLAAEPLEDVLGSFPEAVPPQGVLDTAPAVAGLPGGSLPGDGAAGPASGNGSEGAPAELGEASPWQAEAAAGAPVGKEGGLQPVPAGGDSAGKEQSSVQPAVDPPAQPSERPAHVAAGRAQEEDQAPDASKRTHAAEVADQEADRAAAAKRAAPVLNALAAGLRRLMKAPGAGARRDTFQTTTPDEPVPPPQPGSAALQANRPLSAGGPAPHVHARSSAEQASEQGGDAGFDPIPIALPQPRTAGLESGAGAAVEDGSFGSVMARPVASSAEARLGAELRPVSEAHPDAELLAAAPSAGRSGSSVYDLLVAEIKALKLQQKQLPRALAELQRNASTALAAMGQQLAAAQRRLDMHLNASDTVLLAPAGPALPFCPGPAALPPTTLPTHLPVPSRCGTNPLQESQTAQCGGRPEVQTLAAELARVNAALAAAERREAAALFAVPFLGGLLALGLPGMAGKPPLFRAAVMALVMANGAVGLLLQLRLAFPRADSAGCSFQ